MSYRENHPQLSRSVDSIDTKYTKIKINKTSKNFGGTGGTGSIGNSKSSEPITSKEKYNLYPIPQVPSVISKNVQQNKVMICGSNKSNIDLIRRFMNQLKDCIIITGGAIGIELDVYNNAVINGCDYRINKEYSDIQSNSTRLYYIYNDEHPSRIYIIDDDYEGNLERYKFIDYINERIRIVVIKSFHYH